MNRSRYLSYAILLVFIMITYWQVSLLRHPILWDTFEAAFPWHYFISECLHNGYFPLWNPYAHCGYPFFADPNSGALYPVTLAICLLGKYSIYTVNIEFILTIIMGSFGMYRLMESFSTRSLTALFGAMCFAACGFFISNAEHWNWLTSASWMTWLFWAYHRMLQTLKYGYAMLCAIFLFLLLSGGYIAFLIIVCYILLILFAIDFIAKGDRAYRVLFIKNHIVFSVLFLLMGAACIVSYAETAHFITRGNGISIQKANSLPFSPQCALSFLLPFASLKNDAFYLTDISMRNTYFGMAGLVLFIVGLTVPKKPKEWIVIVFSFLCLLISFGPSLPLRQWLYDYVPLMNLFRFPSLFRIFFLIGFIIIASTTFQRVVDAPVKYRGRLMAAVISLLIVLLLLVGYELRKHGLTGNYSLFLTDISSFIRQSQFCQHIIIQAVIQVMLLSGLLFVIQFRNARLFTARNILLFCALDLFMATQLNNYGTITGTATCKQVNDKTKGLPPQFPVPDNHVPMAAHNDAAYQQQMQPITANLGIFKKDISISGYNPFVINSFSTLCESSIKDSVWANPYLYFAYSVAPIATTGNLPSRSTAAVAGDVYDDLKGQVFTAGDSDRVEVTAFEPGNITATTRTLHTAILVLQQTDYPGWQVFVDGQQTAHFASAYSNISLLLQPGMHHVAFRFAPKVPFALFILSLIAFAGIAICLVVFRKSLF